MRLLCLLGAFVVTSLMLPSISLTDGALLQSRDWAYASRLHLLNEIRRDDGAMKSFPVGPTASRTRLYSELMRLRLVGLRHNDVTRTDNDVIHNANVDGGDYNGVDKDHSAFDRRVADDANDRTNYLKRAAAVAAVSNEMLNDSAAAVAQRRLPSVIIIGAKKSGTRALLEFMKIHPDVRAAGPETHFFDRNYHRGLDWYRSRMPATTSGQVTVEKTPSYFVTRQVPERVQKSMSGDARRLRLIVVVRDPVTRAVSDYVQAATKRTDIQHFEQLAFVNSNSSLNATSCNRVRLTDCYGQVNSSWGAIRVGIYSRHLERWLRRFPLKQFHFVSGERLVSHPAVELRRIERFLDLRPFISPTHFYMNSTKGFPCVRRSTGRRPHCLGQTKGRTHPTIATAAVHTLREFFRPHNTEFYRMTGINFGWP